MKSTQYVGILKRFAALLIDGFILTTINYLLFSLGQSSEPTLKFVVGSFLSIFLISWTYYALFESSAARATPGKMALGIAVTDQLGGRISLAQATIRVFCKFFHVVVVLVAFGIGCIAQGQRDGSLLFALVGLMFIFGMLIFLIGYLMAAFTTQKQALHDRIAKTVVIEFEDESRQFPQQVLLQLAALAIVSRLIFQLTPVTPVPWIALGPTTPATTESTPETSAAPSSTPEPSSTPTPEPPAGNAEVLNICGDTVTIGVVNSNIDLQGKWEFQFFSSNVRHIVIIAIKDNLGTMSTQFFDGELKATATIDQDISLGSSERGTWIVGSNPVDAKTQQKAAKYISDNFFLEISVDGSFKGYNCDDQGKRSPLSIRKLPNA